MSLVFSLTLVVLIFFETNNTIYFYIFFELSIIPIFLIILIWGYQRERLFASLRIFLYTLIASLPLLFILVFLGQKTRRLTLRLMAINTIESPNHSAYLSWMLAFAFLVKTPIYLTHIWLPKAHVEAPVFGSIILAAILLKIGTFGLSLIMYNIFTNFFFWGVLRIRIWRTFIVATFCIKILDIKVLVAYSSVSHMAFLIALIFLSQQLSLMRIRIIIISHGFTSSALFFLVNLIYELSNSRNTLFNKGVFHITSYYLVWAVILISNIRAPPTINFFAEVLGVFALLSRNFMLRLIIIPFIVFTAAYSYTLFRLTAQINTSKPLVFSTHGKNYLILVSHLIPIFIFTFGLTNFY